MNLLVLLGRFFYSALFILASFGHFSKESIAYAATSGVPYPEFLVPLSGVIAFLGGVSILLGYKARLGAWLLIIFLLPVTLMMHQFWGISDPEAAMMDQIMFMKNMSLIGAALLITHFGSGPYSLRK